VTGEGSSGELPASSAAATAPASRRARADHRGDFARAGSTGSFAADILYTVVAREEMAARTGFGAGADEEGGEDDDDAAATTKLGRRRPWDAALGADRVAATRDEGGAAAAVATLRAKEEGVARAGIGLGG
jgi:hypothetical protein